MMNSLQKEELYVVEALIDGATDEQQESNKELFKITDLNSLNWSFRKLHALKAKQSEIEQVAKSERDRIDYWEAEQKKSVQQNIEFFETSVQAYHAQVLADDPKAKTLSTPYGRSKARATKAQPNKTDEKSLLQYVKDNDLTDFIKEEVKWGDLKKTLKVVSVDEKQIVLDENGQAVPGVIVKPASIAYKLEVD